MLALAFKWTLWFPFNFQFVILHKTLIFACITTPMQLLSYWITWVMSHYWVTFPSYISTFLHVIYSVKILHIFLLLLFFSLHSPHCQTSFHSPFYTFQEVPTYNCRIIFLRVPFTFPPFLLVCLSLVLFCFTFTFPYSLWNSSLSIFSPLLSLSHFSY